MSPEAEGRRGGARLGLLPPLLPVRMLVLRLLVLPLPEGEIGKRKLVNVRLGENNSINANLEGTSIYSFPLPTWTLLWRRVRRRRRRSTWALTYLFGM